MPLAKLFIGARRRSLYDAVSEKPVEWLLASVMTGWAFTLAMPIARGLGTGGIDAELAIIFGVFGALRLAALYINGAMPRGPRVRQLCAFIGAPIWMFNAISLLRPTLESGAPLATGVVTYAILSLFEIYSIRVAACDGRYTRD